VGELCPTNEELNKEMHWRDIFQSKRDVIINLRLRFVPEILERVKQSRDPYNEGFLLEVQRLIISLLRKSPPGEEFDLHAIVKRS
jgi:hypothetical protein